MRFLHLGLVALAMAGHAHAKPLSFACDFPSLKMTLTYVVDPTSLLENKFDSAILVGNAGTSEVWVVKGERAISFMEPLATGAVQTTTVRLPSGEAVHSRHTILGLDKEAPLTPSQSRGTCRFLD